MTDLAAEVLIPFVVTAACRAAVLAAAVWAVLAALGDRVPAAWRCGLWLVVLAGLAVPLPGPLGVPTPFAATAPPPAAAPVRPVPPRVAVGAVPMGKPFAEASVSSIPYVPPVPGVPPADAPPAAIWPTEIGDWRVWLAAVWAAGAVVGLGRLVAGVAGLRRAARGWPEVTDPAARAVLEEAKAAAGVRGGVRYAASSAGPAVCGAWRPTLALPPALLADPTALRAAALHEFAHVRRRDVAVGVTTSVIRCLWWPHPAAHLAAARWRSDRELACDAFALDRLSPADRPAYGRLVVDLLSRPRPSALPAAAAGLFPPFPPLKRRIKAMTRHSPATGPRRALAAALLAAAAAGSLVTPTPAAPPPSSPDPGTGEPAPGGAGAVTLAGTAVGPDGAPRAGVRVLLTASDGPLYGGAGHTTLAGESVTGADGGFRFAGLPPLTPRPAEIDRRAPPTGRWFYAVTAAADGLATTTAVFRRPEDTRFPNPPGAPGAMEIKMPAAASLSGAVVDEGGAPIAGARVSVGWSAGDGPGPLAEFRSAVTGADGGFTIRDLAAWDAADTRVRTGPQTSMGSGGMPLEAAAEGYSFSRLSVESIPSKEFVRFELSRAGSLAGSVIDAVTGEPAAGVELAAQATTYPIGPDGTPDTTRSNDVYGWGTAVTDAAGRYEIGPLPPTTYNVLPMETPPDRAAAALEAVRVEPGDATEVRPVRLVRGGLLTGRFLDADGGPIARVPYQWDNTWGGEPPPNPPEWTELSVGLHGPSRPKLLGAAVESAAAGPDGRFSFRVPPGRQFPYMMSGSAEAEWVPRPWTDAGVVVGEGEVVEIVFQLQGPGPNPEPPDGLTFPEPAEPDRAAAAAVRGFGGFYDLDEDGRVVAVDLVSHAPPAGADASDLRLTGGEVYNQRTVLAGAGPVVASLPGLKKLRFWRKQLDDDDLAAAGLSPSLEEVSAVYLTEGTVTDAGMAGLARAKTLKSVRFAEAGLTDASLKAFAGLPKLEYLNLFGNTFTDDGVKALAGAAELETLLLGSFRSDPRVGGPVFTDTSGITDAGGAGVISPEEAADAGLARVERDRRVPGRPRGGPDAAASPGPAADRRLRGDGGGVEAAEGRPPGAVRAFTPDSDSPRGGFAEVFADDGADAAGVAVEVGGEAGAGRLAGGAGRVAQAAGEEGVFVRPPPAAGRGPGRSPGPPAGR